MSRRAWAIFVLAATRCAAVERYDLAWDWWQAHKRTRARW